MAEGTGWQRRFDDPITVDGRTLRTLREAADYIVALPETTSRQEHWQIAVHHLLLAAERGGIMMLAQIAMLKAIHHGTDPSKPVRRKRAKAHRIIR
ncbi:MAG: hypothetical protein R3D82_16060 [Xanthobacteraceae bacterium]